MNEALRNDIIRHWFAGASQRAIASLLGLSRNTVARVLAAVEAARAGQTAQPCGRRGSLLDNYEAVIAELLDRYPDMTVTRVLQELRGSGFTGGYTIVRQRVAQMRPRQEVARHRLLSRAVTGQRLERAEHRPAVAAGQRHEVLRQRFTELGPVALRFLEGLVQSQRYGRDQAQRVLTLLGSYARGDVIAALERALRYGAYSLAAVEGILATQARPMGVLERLAEEERRHLPPLLPSDLVSPRPTSDYQPLLPSEPANDGPPGEPCEDNDPPTA